jgi:hypothetical protein
MDGAVKLWKKIAKVLGRLGFVTPQHGIKKEWRWRGGE